MNRMIAAIAAGLMLTGASLTLAQEDKKPVRRERQERQQKRIQQGVEEGSLTKKEAVKLEAKQAKLAKDIREEKRDGGKLTAKEKYRINEKQDKLSKEIYREKHDAQKKP